MFSKLPINSFLKKEWIAIVVTMCITFILLAIVQLKVTPPLLLMERLFKHGGWIQAILAALLSGWFYLVLYPRATRSRWRIRLWLLFSIVFFTQLLLGITIDVVFLMSGKLHFPIPALIPLGALYRGELSFMPILFLVTVLLSAGAWCSQLCYFGVYDAIAAGKPRHDSLTLSYGTRRSIRLAILSLFIFVVLILRILNYPIWIATLLALVIGILGIVIILCVSHKRKMMLHCSVYCPAGTLVTYLKRLSPWKFSINNHCTHCMACTHSCRYDALTPRSIREHKIASNCTLCGDCLSACRHHALEYRLFRCSPQQAERIWLIVTIVLYTSFLFIARI